MSMTVRFGWRIMPNGAGKAPTKLHRFGLLLLALPAMFCAAPGWSQSSPGNNLPYAGNPPSAQLQVLAPLVGNWSLDIQVAPNAGAPQGVHFAGEAVGQRLLNGQFIRIDGRTSDGKTREEYFVLYWYDAGKAVTVAGIFPPSGWPASSKAVGTTPGRK